MQEAQKDKYLQELISEDQNWLDEFKKKSELSQKNHELEKVVFELNKKAFEKCKKAYDQLKIDYEIQKKLCETSLELSKLNKALIDNTKKTLALQKKHYQRLQFAEFLMEFTPIDDRITGIPALIRAQEIITLEPDFDFPINCSYNVVARLDWDISNQDILVSSNFINSWLERRVNCK